MKTSTHIVIAVATVLISSLATVAIIVTPSYFRSEDYAFMQLMGNISKGESRASVRWIYIKYRALPMRLAVEQPDVMSVRGRWHGDPASLVIHFVGGRVDRTSLDLLPPYHAR